MKNIIFTGAKIYVWTCASVGIAAIILSIKPKEVE